MEPLTISAFVIGTISLLLHGFHFRTRYNCNPCSCCQCSGDIEEEPQEQSKVSLSVVKNETTVTK